MAQARQGSGDEIGHAPDLGDVRRSGGDIVGEFGVAATICVNSLRTFWRNAVNSGVISGSISGKRSMRARRNGSTEV
jgi:hypothetical protein